MFSLLDKIEFGFDFLFFLFFLVLFLFYRPKVNDQSTRKATETLYYGTLITIVSMLIILTYLLE